jgi:hypothetical protein
VKVSLAALATSAADFAEFRREFFFRRHASITGVVVVCVLAIRGVPRWRPDSTDDTQITRCADT